MGKIYIIRHAEAEGNIYRRIHGWYNSMITKNGYRQLAALSERFRDIPVDAVYASDLYRTCVTAHAVADRKGLPVIKDSRFREVHLGSWEDLPFGYLDYADAEQYYNFGRNYDAWSVPGAENWLDCAGRFLAGLEDIARRHKDGTAAVVTHGCVSNWGMYRLFPELAGKTFRCDNTAVSLLTWSEEEGFKAEYLYDNSHLTPEISTLAHQLWWRGTKDFNLWFRPSAPEDSALFPALRPESGETCFTGFLMEVPVGFVRYAVRGATAELRDIFLLPERRHIRMGDQLLGAVVIDARSKGLSRLLAGVPAENAESCAFFSKIFPAPPAQEGGNRVYSMDIALPEY